jgi:carboxymethylenebutenolidase
LYNHGSRVGQERQPFTPALAPCWQIVAGIALLVFFPERRGYGGSDGHPYSEENPQSRWTAEQTRRALNRLHAEASDVVAGLDYLKSRGLGDHDRTAMLGYSLGGVVTFFAAAMVPLRVTAVISQAAGVGVGRGQAALDLARDELITAGLKISAPVLVQHAVNDHLVPVSVARQAVSALTSAGKTIKYQELPAVVQPDGHLLFALANETNRQHWWPQVSDFVKTSWKVP